MTFRVGIGSTHIASFSANGVPYLWQTGDVNTLVGVGTTINATNGATNDYFGGSVAVGCGRIVISSSGDDVGSNANQGSVYIFDLDGNQVGFITASNGADGDAFGSSVAVGSGRIVVGASGDDIASNTNQGSAYIFDLDGNQVGFITASDGANSDSFGRSVAVGSGRIVVGARNADFSKGKVYIYNLDGSGEIILKSSTVNNDFTISNSDEFGNSVAVGCGRIVVGAPGVDIVGSNSTNYDEAGRAYIFDLNGHYIASIDAGTGINVANGYNNNHNPEFGTSVAVGCGRIVVGAPNEYQETIVVNGSSQFGAWLAGAVYIYDLNGVLIKRIEAKDPKPQQGAEFGESVAVGCGRIVVGSWSYDITDDGNYIDYWDIYYGTYDGTPGAGATYIYDLDGNFLEKILPDDPQLSAFFGNSVAVGCGRIVVGSNFRDVGSNSSEGEAYIYETPDVITAYDVADWNSY